MERKNLLSLPGSTPRERAINIANCLWSEEERRLLCIDPRKALTGNTKPADKERTKVFHEVLKKVFGANLTVQKYQDVLKYVNQQGVDLQKKQKAEKENVRADENTNQ